MAWMKGKVLGLWVMLWRSRPFFVSKMDVTILLGEKGSAQTGNVPLFLSTSCTNNCTLSYSSCSALYEETDTNVYDLHVCVCKSQTHT